MRSRRRRAPECCATKYTFCILLDVTHWGAGWLAIVDALREYGALVIVTSEHGDIPTAVQAIQAGPQDFIQKPFEAEVLLTQVRSALKIGEGNSQNPVSGAAAAAPAAEAPRIKGSVVLISGIDDYLMGKMQDFLKQQGHTIELSGQEDDTLEQALKLKPKLILGQYVENPLTFDLRKIQKKLKENPETASLRLTVFCPSQIGVDALKILDKTDDLLYSKSD